MLVLLIHGYLVAKSFDSAASAVLSLLGQSSPAVKAGELNTPCSCQHSELVCLDVCNLILKTSMFEEELYVRLFSSV